MPRAQVTPASVYSSFCLLLFLLLITGCAGIGNSPPPPPPPPPPPSNATATLAASPTTITAGQFSTLTWTTTNATSVTFSPALPTHDANALPVSGQSAVTPAQTTTFTLTAKGSNGSTATATATVTVNQVPPTITISAQPMAVASGGSSTLTWAATNADSVTIDHGIGSVAAQGGTISTGPISQTTTFTATAQGKGGSASANVTVTVSPIAVTLTANPATISASGQAVTLSWTSSNAVSVSIDQGVGTVTPTGGGSVTVHPTGTTTYTATAKDANGITTTAKAVVTLSGALQKSINHIIWMVQENRSFDSYFGKLGLYRVGKGLPKEINGIDDDSAVTLTDLQGHPRHPYHYQTECTENLTPAWNESHHDVDGGKMDGFMQTTNSVPEQFDPSGSRAMGYYTQADLPYYYELATQFATSDSVFSPVMTNTIGNRLYLFTATSFGTIYPDTNPSTGKPEWNPDSYKQKTIFDLLNQNNVTWKYYFQDNSIFLGSFSDWTNPDGTPNKAIQSHVFPISDYFNTLSQLNADQLLPQVVFIERGGDTAATDEHPDNSVQAGAAVVANLMNALMKSTAWPDSVFILTFDEGGGLYDHVIPIKVPAPDSVQPFTSNVPFPVEPGDFTDTGFRVPFVVVSPWVKPHYVSHVKTDYTAMLKFIEARFQMSPLTLRDGASSTSDLNDFFDFTAPHLLTPPTLPVQPTNGVCDKSKESGGS